MKIEAKVILKSKNINNPNAPELTTIELTYPRFIHAEIMTHRVLSRNASSSRAIPVNKLTAMALEDPAFFVSVGQNQPGMQPGNEVPDEVKNKFYEEWVELANINAKYALRWANEYNIHKQVVNRVMEPWHHIKVIATATEWNNLFSLRCHPSAQAEFQELACKMRDAINSTQAQELSSGQWHLPYVTDEEKQNNDIDTCLKISVARCARVSYMNHDGSKPDIQKDIKLHDDLVGSEPIHASPAEHQAQTCLEIIDKRFNSNLVNWLQYRKLIENKNLRLKELGV
jgi:thymidylate synthase ThyX